MPNCIRYDTANNGIVTAPDLWLYEYPDPSKSETIEEVEKKSLERVKDHAEEALWQRDDIMSGATFLHKKMANAHSSEDASSVEWLREYVKFCPPEALGLSDCYGFTPFLIAARAGRNDYLEVLLDHDPELSTARNDDGESALHMSVKRKWKQSFDTVKLLVKRCPELLDVTDALGKTPLGIVNERLAMLSVVKYTAMSNPDLDEEKETSKSMDLSPNIYFSFSHEMYSKDDVDGVEEDHELYQIVDMYSGCPSVEDCDCAKALVEKNHALPSHKVGMRGPYGGLYNYSTPFLRALGGVLRDNNPTRQQSRAFEMLEYMLDKCPKAASVGDAVNTFPLHVVGQALELERASPLSAKTPTSQETRSMTGGKLKSTIGRMRLAEQIFDLYPKAALIGNDEGCTPLMLAVRRFAPYDLVDMLCRKCPEAVVVQRDGGGTPLKFAEEKIEIFSSIRNVMEEKGR